MRTWKLEDIFHKLNEILVGYYHYYGITDNAPSLYRFCYRIRRILFYWRGRRSQRKSYTWQGFNDLLKHYPLARPKVYYSIYGS